MGFLNFLFGIKSNNDKYITPQLTSSDEPYKTYFDLSHKIEFSKNIYDRLETCEKSYKILKNDSIDENCLKSFIRFSLLLRKEKYKNTNRLFLNEDMLKDSDIP